MKKVFLLFYLLTFLLLLTACGGKHDAFLLEGTFKGFNQGELYIYGVNGTWPLDTIGVAKGQFRYSANIEEPTAFVLVFPNFSELLVVGERGAEVEIEGDASHLAQAKITGTKENEALTAFRRHVAELSLPETAKAIEELINDFPYAPFANYLIQRFFIQGPNPDYQRAAELVKAIYRGNPDLPPPGDLIRWLKGIDALRDGNKLPTFSTTDLNGRSVSNTDLNAPVNVVTVWSTWNYESQNIQRVLQRKYNEANGNLKVLSICVDADIKAARRAVTKDSVKWSTVCDGKLWDTPVLHALGLSYIPDNIITDANGKIIAHGLANRDLMLKIDNLLPKKPKE